MYLGRQQPVCKLTNSLLLPPPSTMYLLRSPTRPLLSLYVHWFQTCVCVCVAKIKLFEWYKSTNDLVLNTVAVPLALDLLLFYGTNSPYSDTVDMSSMTQSSNLDKFIFKSFLCVDVFIKL